MAEEIENIYDMLSNSAAETENQCFELYRFQINQKQQAIKTDLEISHFKVKTRLLQETLENKNKELETMEELKRNNKQLLSLLEKYDMCK